MNLGNTNRGNVGKKYLMRATILERHFTESETERASEFNAWFVKNLHSLKQQWINKGQFDEDVFTDTYIRICESLGFGDSTLKDYRAYFSRSYYTNYILNKKKSNRFLDIDISLLNQEQKGDIHLFEEEYEELISAVFSKAKTLLSTEEYKIFKDYLHWKEKQAGKRGGSCLNYSKLVGEKPHIIEAIFAKGKSILLKDETLNRKIKELYKLI